MTIIITIIRITGKKAARQPGIQKDRQKAGEPAR